MPDSQGVLSVNTNINIRMDRDLKVQFEAFCAEIPNAVTRKAIEDAENGIGMSKGFSSVAELMEDLNADD